MPIKIGKYYITQIGIGVAVLLLAALFIFPKMYLDKVTHELKSRAISITEAVVQDNWKEAEAKAASMVEYFDAKKDALKSFTHHKVISELETSVHASRVLAEVEEEKSQLLIELQNIISISQYLHNLETFDISNLF